MNINATLKTNAQLAMLSAARDTVGMPVGKPSQRPAETAAYRWPSAGQFVGRDRIVAMGCGDAGHRRDALAVNDEAGFGSGQRSRRSNLDIISDHYAASARQDVAAMMADMAPDVRWTEMAGFECGGPWVGPAQVIKHMFKVLGTEWIGHRFELEKLIDGGDRVVGVGTYTGKYGRTREFNKARVAHFWQLKDEKIVSCEQVLDTLPELAPEGPAL